MALLIGNEDYQDDTIPDLGTPIADVESVGEILRKRYGFKTEISLPDGQRHNLVLKNATKAQIIFTLETLGPLVEKNDQVIIYFAGHGEVPKGLNEAFWFGADSINDNAFTWIASQDVTRITRLMNAQHVLLISDSCFSGATREAGSFSDEKRKKSTAEIWSRPSRTLLASGANEPVSDGGGDGHSVFARALLTGLEKMKASPFTVGELVSDYIKPVVPGNAGHVPVYKSIDKSGDTGGELVLVPQ